MSAHSKPSCSAWLPIAVVSLAPGAWAQSPRAWGASVTSGNLTEVDLATGTATAVGPLGVEVTGLAHDPNSDTLYGIQRFPGTLVTIDRTNGSTTPVGPLGIEKVAAGAAYDPNTDSLYMADFVNANDLWTINTTTGTATSVGTHGLATLQGLAFDASTNTLYATSGNGSTSALYTLNTATATPTLVGSFTIQVFDHGLGYDGSTGKLYLAEANAAVNMLYEVDTTTANLTAVGPLGDSIQGFDIEGQTGGPGTALCFGDGSGAPCGCGNEAPAGSGSGCLNSCSTGAVLSSTSGSGNIGDTVDLLTLQADGIRSLGLFFMAVNTINGGAGVTFGDGVRCCGGSVLRISIESTGGTCPPTTSGTVTTTITTNSPTAGGSGQLMAGITSGDKRCFQYWYRDPGAGNPCGAALFNLSNALTVTFGP